MNVSFEKWLKETKEKNLSLVELEEYIRRPSTCPYEEVYSKLQGLYSSGKAKILYDLWNSPEKWYTQDEDIDLPKNGYFEISSDKEYRKLLDYLIGRGEKIHRSAENYKFLSNWRYVVYRDGWCLDNVKTDYFLPNPLLLQNKEVEEIFESEEHNNFLLPSLPLRIEKIKEITFSRQNNNNKFKIQIES